MRFTGRLCARLLLLAVCAAAARTGRADARLRAVYTVPGELNDIVGHVQGAACSTQGVYLSHAGGLYKIGWDGRLLRSCAAPVHLGDVAYADGRLYGALALRAPVGGQRGMIRVWDEELNVVGEHLLPGPVDGCAVLGGTLYYGLDPYGPAPHRLCQIGRLARGDFRDLGVVTLDPGGRFHYGVQTMATDGARLFCGYYAAGAPPVTCAWFTPDLRACGGTPPFVCSEGFDRLPPALFPSAHPRFFAVRALGGGPRAWHSVTNPPRVRLDFYEWRDGRFVDVTERRPPPPLAREDLCASDPFIYVDRAARLYRLYLPARAPDGSCAGVAMHTSRDLQAWSAARQVLRARVEAPEVHAYKGRFYLIATHAARGAQIYRAETPEGPFRAWSAGPLLGAADSRVRDATLWVEDGTPHLVFRDAREGRLAAVALAPDLKAAAGAPFTLVRADAAGPFLYRSRTGALLLLWTSAGARPGVDVARAAHGRLAGPWGPPARLLDGDGGQAMLFRTIYGQLALCLHRPDAPPQRRRLRILHVEDGGDALRVVRRER